MQDPFSPFVSRKRTLRDVHRRQSQVPSELIDWDAPTIPEIEKQRIVFEQVIREAEEDNAIESLVSEVTTLVAVETLMDEKLAKERARINLLLGQLKMFENHTQDLESQAKTQEEEIVQLKDKVADLEFKNNELDLELDAQMNLFTAKKAEGEELRKKFENTQKQLTYYKRISKEQ